jgi:hypothetical protein
MLLFSGVIIVFKTAIKCFAALWCGLIGLFLFCIAQPIPPGTVYAQVLATGTPQTSNASVSFTIVDSGGFAGQPGTKILISGQGFKSDGQNSVTLYATNDPVQCKTGGSLYPFNPNTATIQGGGFSLQTWWPRGSAPGQPPENPGGSYYICALSAQDETVLSSQMFTVASTPTATPAAGTVRAGEQLTINGTNWVPPEQLTVSVVSANDPTAQIVSGMIVPDQSGQFSLTLTIPTTAAAGQYTIRVVTTNDAMGPQLQSGGTVTLEAQVTATPSPSATAEASPTATATQTVGATTTPTTTTPSNTGNNNPKSTSPTTTALIFILGGLGLVLVVIGLIMFAASAPPQRRIG